MIYLQPKLHLNLIAPMIPWRFSKGAYQIFTGSQSPPYENVFCQLVGQVSKRPLSADPRMFALVSKYSITEISLSVSE
jgi:hypothetical protein